jgi:hypothetical protein
MNLLIIGYCNLHDGFLYASNALKKLNYNIFFFPYHNYVIQQNNNRDNILIDFIKNNNINVILWWYNNITFETINSIKNSFKIKNIFFNWDPFLYNYNKYNSLIWKGRIDERLKYYPLMDSILSCFEKEVTFCKTISNIFYTPPGFDKDVSKYEYNLNYQCDVSIVCTNLYDYTYEFPDEATNITRYSIVNKLYEYRDKIKFHIYGLEKFRSLFPDCYKGFISYNDSNKVFSNSKINLSIHPILYELNSENSSQEYFSERLPQILGSKGLLVTNSNLSSYLKKNIDYIHIDNSSDWFEKIMIIINNNDSYNIIRENGYKKGLQYYQWDNWALSVHNSIVEKKIKKIIIINVTINWIYRLYQEYIESIKYFATTYFKDIEFDIIYFDKITFEEKLFDSINFNNYDKVFYSGDLEILKILVEKNNNNYSKLYFINIEQMSNQYYYKMIRTIDHKINIIDYSEENIPYFENIYNIYLIPPYFNYKNEIDFKNKDIDILSLKNNNYRETLLKTIESNIQQKLNIIFFDNTYGEVRDNLYYRSKIYINIHCSNNHKTMEMIRIVNLITNKVIIISQSSVYNELLFLKDFIIVCNNDYQISDYISEVLNNYDYYFNKIYGNSNETNYISYIKNNLENILLR